MSFLRRLFRSDGGAPRDAATEHDAGEPEPEPEPDTAEADRELNLLREDQARQDELMARQQRYARYAWQPPRQGGERRADDAESSKGG